MNKEKQKMFDLIPKEVLELLERGHGRDSISNLLNISEPLARHFCWLYNYIKSVDINNININNVSSNDGARVLVIDIETAPMIGAFWHLGKQHINFKQILKSWFIISYAYKWLFDDKTECGILTPTEMEENNDRRLANQLHELLNEADIVIAHHGQYFDLPRIRERFLKHGMPPTTPYRILDTCKELKKIMRPPSYALDFLTGTFYNIGNKIETNFKLWLDCLAGNQEALDKMAKYNKYDVDLLEELYIKIRPHIKGHPNMGLYMDTEQSVCTHCGSDNLIEKGYYYTNISQFQCYYCKDCTAIGSRSRKSEIDKTKRDSLLTSIVR